MSKTLKPLPTGVVRATTEHMPFTGHRTCAQWADNSHAHYAPREMTEAEREKDAVEGSAHLRDAIYDLANRLRGKAAA